ncbi:calcium channel, voltage-dependent, L type, alpha 1C subunit isoform 8, partial [Reticulomyxa filosa]
MELQEIAEEIENNAHDELQFEMDDKENWTFSQRASKQNAQRKEMIEQWIKGYNGELTDSIWELSKPIQNDYLNQKPKIILQLNQLVQSSWFENAILVIIVLNAIVLALVWPHMNNHVQDALEILNAIFTVIFSIELLLKLFGLGYSYFAYIIIIYIYVYIYIYIYLFIYFLLQAWAYNYFNIFDGIIVVISLVDLIVSRASHQPKTVNTVLAFRTLRVLRILRLFHHIRPLRILLTAVIEAVEPIGLLFLIIALFLFTFGVLGVQMFSSHVQDLKKDIFSKFTRPWRFDTLWFSIVTFMQLFSGDGWMYVMNLCLAILINRMQNQDDVQLMLEDLVDEGRELWKKYSNDEEKGKAELETIVINSRKKRAALQSAARHKARVEKLRNREKITGVSLHYFTPINPVRTTLHKWVSADWFEWSINVLIIINCVFLGLNSPHVKRSSQLGIALSALDKLFTSIFCLELVMKVIAYGLYESKSTEVSNTNPHQNLVSFQPQAEDFETKIAENEPADDTEPSPKDGKANGIYSNWGSYVDNT